MTIREEQFIAPIPLDPGAEKPRVSVAVMAHPSREREVEELVGRLDRPATVVWDRKSCRWDTGRRSQLAFDPSATHHLVVQDDAIVCSELVAGLEHALQWVPRGAAASLYIGAVRPYAGRIGRAVDRAAGCSWIVMRDLHWGVGIVLPTPIIERLVTEQDARTNIIEYDRRISRWLVTHGVPVWYTFPSLVDHRHSPSLLGHGDTRHAFQFIGEKASPFDVDWGGPALRVPDPRAAAQMMFPRRIGPGARPVVTRRGVRTPNATAPPTEAGGAG